MATTKFYCSTDDVYRYAGIGSDVVSTANVEEFIKEAEVEVDNFTQSTYWQLATSATASAGDTDTLTTTGLTEDEHVGNVIYIKSGTGLGQYRIIMTNSTTVITVDRDWTVEVDNTSVYQIFHTGTIAFKNTLEDGDGQYTTFVEDFPLVNLESLEIDSTSVTTTNVFQYKDVGQLTLGTDAEYTNFKAGRQTVETKYFFGVWNQYTNNVSALIKKYTAITAAMMSLASQIGGTYDDVTVFSLGPMSGSLGEPYTNIREGILKLKEERKRITTKLTIYQHLY